MSNYIIDFDKLTILNPDSNGAKAIVDVHNEDGVIFHLSYVNNNGRLWYQQITEHEADKIVWTREAQDATVDNAYYGLGEGMLL